MMLSPYAITEDIHKNKRWLANVLGADYYLIFINDNAKGLHNLYKRYIENIQQAQELSSDNEDAVQSLYVMFESINFMVAADIPFVDSAFMLIHEVFVDLWTQIFNAIRDAQSRKSGEKL